MLSGIHLNCARLCRQALLHRAVIGKPLGVLKYAMTLDGKIATSAGHSAWVSCPASRQRVFEARARSDAVVVGGQTVRRDNPRLTTRRDDGHAPARIVMSRTLDLPEVRTAFTSGLDRARVDGVLSAEVSNRIQIRQLYLTMWFLIC